MGLTTAKDEHKHILGVYSEEDLNVKVFQARRAPGERVQVQEDGQGARAVRVRDLGCAPSFSPPLVGGGVKTGIPSGRVWTELAVPVLWGHCQGGWMGRVQLQKCCLQRGQEACWALSQLSARTP